MAASLDQDAEDSLADLLLATADLEAARATHADARLRYIRDARHARWPWRRIAAAVGQTDKAVRLYWEAHRHRAGRL